MKHWRALSPRCIGALAHAPEGAAMPHTYDPRFGQAWCRNRLAYLLHDIMVRVTWRRAEAVGATWR